MFSPNPLKYQTYPEKDKMYRNNEHAISYYTNKNTLGFDINKYGTRTIIFSSKFRDICARIMIQISQYPLGQLEGRLYGRVMFSNKME